MSDVEIVTPPVASTDIDLDLVNLTEFLVTRTGAEHVGGFLGGEWGYGTEFENDTFLMHPYCWCERDDCPWCGGCSGRDLHPGHGPDCYQARLGLLRAKYATDRTDFGDGPHPTGYWGNPDYDRERTALCRSMSLDPQFGAEVHCSCGADDEAKRRISACDCDWHKGRDPFRFGPATAGPNFWHKPSGLMVRWYKWIGRDTEYAPAKPGPGEWRRIFAECIASVA